VADRSKLQIEVLNTRVNPNEGVVVDMDDWVALPR
jgi:hypothetical protein